MAGARLGNSVPERAHGFSLYAAAGVAGIVAGALALTIFFALP